jgi:hypothetical protein
VLAAVLPAALMPRPAGAQSRKEGREKKPRTVQAATGLIRYDVPGGESFFALSLKAESLPPAAPRDHVILVDTSASQAGAHRKQVLAVLEACLGALGKAERVRLFAFDLRVTPLGDNFAPPQSDETKTSIAKLRRIVPLGAADLAPAFETALESFDGNRGRSILFIGDGMSTANLVKLPDLRDLLSRLREKRVPVTIFAIGPRTDLQLLGCVAEHTGGAVFVDALIDNEQVPAAEVGRKLAGAATAPVFYPERISVEPDLDRLLPDDAPPIRADRTTILLGKGGVGDQMKVVARGEGRTFDWTVKPAPPQAGNTFLVGLWGLAEQTEGLAVAVAGQELLEVAREEFEENLAQLVAQGRAAVAARNLKLAEQIADLIRQLDPANVEARTILNAAEKAKAAAAALDKETKGAPSRRSDEQRGQSPKANANYRGEKLKRLVLQTVEAARSEGKSDRDGALDTLKRALNTLESSSDIPPDVRDELREKVQAAIDELEKPKQKK